MRLHINEITLHIVGRNFTGNIVNDYDGKGYIDPNIFSVLLAIISCLWAMVVDYLSIDYPDDRN